MLKNENTFLKSILDRLKDYDKNSTIIVNSTKSLNYSTIKLSQNLLSIASGVKPFSTIYPISTRSDAMELS